MKKHITMLLLATINLNAQSTAVVQKNLLKLNLFLPGVVYEHGFNAKNTLYSEVSSGFGLSYNSFSGARWTFLPLVNEQFRHYYNLEKRSLKGKRTAGNSGNFVAFNAIYNFKSISTGSFKSNINDASFTLAPVWGMQRTYKRNFNLSLNAGYGYNIYADTNYNENGFGTVFNFSIGWLIRK